ncbi:hypothetical protein AUK40_04240 [Candidatus Wirthbacteria bacterium CG2_30_54_11]|uniref:DUF2000 domain-containing protein n=1 Tax=Candidatus Wirthbacteria bacterium CG2_30_54_11 TaxID=1817892 RepID=A0A1J5IIN3_9BACT|nr:MAG: hypothetical protein AUK40_04240 [Candidatus Wirthbacteria bacterium CG2_30_54_11]
MNDQLPDENSCRFTAVLNRKVPVGNLLNALGHMTAGLAGGYRKADDLWFLKYEDADGGLHPYISHFPFIVLEADNSNQIRAVRQQAVAQGISFTDFTSTMTIGTSAEQLQATKSTPEAGLEYYGICLFGPTDQIKALTKKFSLFRT